MDRFFDRLGDVIKNFLDDEDDRLFGQDRRATSSGDPDLDAAYDELDEFLKTGKNRPSTGGTGSTAGSARTSAWADPREGGGADSWNTRFREQAKGGGMGKTSEVLRGDFAELGVPFGSSAEVCKAAYKKLLKLHHPDRHAGHPGNMKKATEKSARINAAYQRIEQWRETGKAE